MGYVGGNPIAFVDPDGLVRNSKNGKWEQRAPKPPKPDPANVRDPIKDTREKNEKTEDAVDALKNLFCMLTNTCIPDEALTCLELLCTPSCETEYECLANCPKPFKVPPSITSVMSSDTKCVCSQVGISKNRMNPPGL